MVFTFLPFSAFAAGGVTGGYSTIELSNHNFPDILNVKVVPSLPTLRPLQTWQTRIPPRQPSGAWSKG